MGTRRLLAVPGVGAVARVGGVTREARVALDPLRLQALGVSAAEVSQRLRQAQMESAGGRAGLGEVTAAVRELPAIATKNSILLVEYAIVARRDHGMGRLGALLDACHKRARPIIMTTLAMSAGMMPVALALGGADMSFRSPMAVAVIGGLITSTVLSLLVVPAVFTCIDDFGQWPQHPFRRTGAADGKRQPAG